MEKSLNDSSFILNDNQPLPTNLFGYQSQLPGEQPNRISQLVPESQEELKEEEKFDE